MQTMVNHVKKLLSACKHKTQIFNETWCISIKGTYGIWWNFLNYNLTQNVFFSFFISKVVEIIYITHLEKKIKYTHLSALLA